ncbi:MAG: flagellar hook-length control protein FliK [Lachnospiraceae bacterium]|nr:flagellar hook-length control protein FliK [Lachnospiraceae bacterium]
MQIQESVNAANFLSVGMSTSNKGGNTDEVPGSDFASFLNSSGNSKDKIEGGVSPEKELFPAREQKDVRNTDKVNDKKTDLKDNTKSVDTKSTQKTQQKDVKGDVKPTDAVSNGEVSDVPVDEEVLEQAIEVLSDVVGMIMNQLDMNLEEVQTVLDDTGLSFGDLLTDDGLKTFFLEVQSADISDVLTDEALGNAMQDFISQMDTAIDETDINVEDVIKTLNENEITSEDIKLFDEEADTIVGEAAQTVIDNPVSKDTDYIDTLANVTVNEENDALKPQIEVEVDNGQADEGSTKDSHGKNASAKEIKTEYTNQILQGITDAVNNVEEVIPTTETGVRQSDIIEQIIEQVRVNINQDNTSMEMQLYPEHLGRIQIHVVSKDGVMTARIAAETETARQAIEAGLSNLKESLQNQNLKVEAIEVMVSTAAFAESDQQREQFEQQQAGKRSGRLGFGGVDEDESDEEIEAQRMQAEGSSVSYLA